MYIDYSVSRQNGKTYSRVLLRTSYWDDGKVKHKTIANLSKCSKEEIDAMRLAFKHKKDLTGICPIEKSLIKTKAGLSIGAIWLLSNLADRLGISAALGNSQIGKLALWQIMARIIGQGSRLSAVRLAKQHDVCGIIGLNSFNEDDLYENLDWLNDNQEEIENKLFETRYAGKGVPSLYLYDVTSSYLEGTENELGDFGYNRDGKKGKRQIVIGLLTDDKGVPISVEVFRGNTQDPATFVSQIKKLAERFGVKEVTMVGDRGMIKSGQIDKLNEAQFYYITAITKVQIESLLTGGLIRLCLFDENLCEVELDGIRYIVRRNPLRQEDIRINREEKIEKAKKIVEKENKYLVEHEKAKADNACKRVDKWLKKLNISDFCFIEEQNRCLEIKIDEAAKEEAEKLDGCYCLKTNLGKDKAQKEEVHSR